MRRGFRAIAAAITGAALLTGFAGCGGDDSSLSADDLADLAEALSFEVGYYVEGSADSASITIETPTGTSQQQDIPLPIYNKTGDLGLHMTFQRGDFVYVSAQNDSEYGKVTCRIEVDGEVISENSASGAYAIATCKGRA
jgi:hypothetical protein